jgi:hypothetical protein
VLAARRAGRYRPGVAHSLDFRRVPAIAYLGLAASLASSIVFAIAFIAATGEPYERFAALHRWELIDSGCSVVQAVLVSLALFELARRSPRRRLAIAAAWLALGSLLYFVLTISFNLIQPRDFESLYDWFSRAIGVTTLAGAFVLIATADGWRTAPAAAAVLIVLHLTSYWVPGVQSALRAVIGDNFTGYRLYAIAREAIAAGCTLALLAAIATAARPAAADTAAAARGFRLARGALVFRMVAAFAIAFLIFGARSPGAAKFAVIVGPLIIVATTFVFAIALERAAREDVGLPRVRLAVGVGLTLWSAAIQLFQVSALYEMITGDRGERAQETAQLLSISGPVAATIGIALIGSSLAAFATARNHAELAQSARARTIAFVVASLGSVWLQTLLAEARSLNMLLVIGLTAAAIAVIALAMVAGVLRMAAEQLETAPGLPQARVVD